MKKAVKSPLDLCHRNLKISKNDKKSKWKPTNFSNRFTAMSNNDAFQGVLATGDIAQKCGDNIFLFHRQPTKTNRKKGDNLRQRKSIFTFDKVTCFRFAFFDSDVFTR